MTRVPTPRPPADIRPMSSSVGLVEPGAGRWVLVAHVALVVVLSSAALLVSACHRPAPAASPATTDAVGATGQPGGRPGSTGGLR